MFCDTNSFTYKPNTSHPAVRPYKYKMSDTSWLKPVVYINSVNNRKFALLGSTGIQFYYSHNKFAIEGNLTGGLYIPPDIYSEYTDTTGIIPLIGKGYNNGQLYYFADPVFQVSYKTDYINFSAGRGRFALGESHYSILRSGMYPATPFVSADVDIWKIHYTYRIDLLHNPDLRFPQDKFGTSYNISHFFDFAIWNWLNITMFETAIQDPIDSLGARRGFDINYLNPVAFFRAVDLSLGSPDNILLGLGGSIRIKKTAVLYGYGILDEMLVSHLLAGDGYWGLKYGLQAGAKIYSPFVKGLFVQGELTAVKPYTFSHANPVLAYGNYYHPLGHPLGANFYQAFAQINYSASKINLNIEASYSIYGQNDTLNYGQNIFLSYLTRAKEFGVYTTQGIRTERIYIKLSGAYRIKKNYFLGIDLGLRNTKNKTETLTEPFVSISVRNFNLGYKYDLF